MLTRNLKYTYPTGIALILVGYFIFSRVPQLISQITFCPLKTVTGIPCPACGSTRATSLLFHGNYWDAFLLNPLALVVNILIILSIFWMLHDIVKRKDTFIPSLKKDWNAKTKFIVFGILLANWIWNICKGL